MSVRRALRLGFSSVVLAGFEAVGTLVSGLMAGSVALVAFGADSIIEMMSAVVVISQLRSLLNEDVNRRREHRAHRVIATLFFALATYVVIEAAWALASGHRTSENPLGIWVCVASLLLMPSLAGAKVGASRRLQAVGLGAVARIVRADASETAICALLSATTIIGVLLCKVVGWWWSDPVASVAVVVFAMREGSESWHCDDD